MRLLSLAALIMAAMLAAAPGAGAGAEVALKFDRAQLEARWQARIQSFLDRGIIPLIDLESSLKRSDGEQHLADTLPAMDALGVALIAFDGRPDDKHAPGGEWGYYIHEIVNAHPGRFILATNGGTNPDWTGGGTAYLTELEKQVRTGAYPIMGEIEFRHYMSGRQCRKGRTNRDVDVAIDGANGQRVFRLSAQTGVPFVIHHEAEDRALDGLEKMLKAYPRARVAVAHFGQIRHPDRQARFGPKLVRRLLAAYPNLYYELSTGQPNRKYKCEGKVLDTVIWQDGERGRQTDTLKPSYKAILTEFSTRFVAGTDYGGGRRALPDHLAKKTANIRLIMRDLPEGAQHDIGYRNAWRRLTGREWTAPAASPAKTQPAAPARRAVPYDGVISDGHGHLEGRKADPDAVIKAMDSNDIDRVVVWVKSKGGWTDDDTLDFQRRHPTRVVAGIAFQNKGWRGNDPGFMDEVAEKARSGRFGWFGEVSFRGKIGGKPNASPDDPRLKELLALSVETGLPITIHHNPYERDGGKWRRTAEYDALVEALSGNSKAVVVWAHWCGLATPAIIRGLFARLPNLHCGLGWIHKPQSNLPTRLIDSERRFLPQWKKLIEDFPDRFLAGIDNAAKPGQMRDFDRRVRIIRTALGGLKPDVAARVATANFHRVAGIKR